MFLTPFITPIPKDTSWHRFIHWMDAYRDIRLLWNFGDLILSVVFIFLFWYVIHQMAHWKRCTFEKHQKLAKQMNEIAQVQEQVLARLNGHPKTKGKIIKPPQEEGAM